MKDFSQSLSISVVGSVIFFVDLPTMSKRKEKYFLKKDLSATNQVDYFMVDNSCGNDINIMMQTFIFNCY